MTEIRNLGYTTFAAQKIQGKLVTTRLFGVIDSESGRFKFQYHKCSIMVRQKLKICQDCLRHIWKMIGISSCRHSVTCISGSLHGHSIWIIDIINYKHVLS